MAWIVKVVRMAEGRKFAGGVLLFVALLSYIMMFQGSRGIWEPDEGCYTNIALRMLRTGDFLVPEFNEDAPHFAKPPRGSRVFLARPGELSGARDLSMGVSGRSHQ